jgi:hypothetical protein
MFFFLHIIVVADARDARERYSSVSAFNLFTVSDKKAFAFKLLLFRVPQHVCLEHRETSSLLRLAKTYCTSLAFSFLFCLLIRFVLFIYEEILLALLFWIIYGDFKSIAENIKIVVNWIIGTIHKESFHLSAPDSEHGKLCILHSLRPSMHRSQLRSYEILRK